VAVPEGDTLHRLAAKLGPALTGASLLAVVGELATIEDWQLLGRQVAGVEARGKNLLIHCAPLVAVEGRPDPRVVAQLPVAIWSHLGMRGAWHLRRADEPESTRERPTLALHTPAHVASCYRPKHLALLGPRSLLRHPMLADLGPDLLGSSGPRAGSGTAEADPDAGLDEAVARLRALGPVELGVAIMRQSAVAGIGNVYKSELLFLARLSPFTGVTAIPPDPLRALLARARTLMRANVEAGGPRRTMFESGAPHERLWVYERSGRPCRVCGTIIAMRRQGELARSTYFCPTCQRAGEH
jgi:endonuclease VIII